MRNLLGSIVIILGCIQLACVSPDAVSGIDIAPGAIKGFETRLDNLEKLFESMTLQFSTVKNITAERIYGGAGWSVLTSIGIIVGLGIIALLTFRSYLSHLRATRGLGLLTTAIDELPEKTKRDVKDSIEKVVGSNSNKFSAKDKLNIRKFVELGKI